MKPILTTLSAIAFATTVFAQSPDKALAKVSYTFSHVRDTTQRDKPYTETMLLIIGKNASIYTSYDKIAQSEIRKKMIEQQIKETPEGQPMKINLGKVKPTSSIDYFLFAKEKQLFVKEPIVNDYLTEEPAFQIAWKVTKDTASFSGVHCQKALANFKGRNWIAWYAPELPFQSGPWKLNGLPGLIIEAYDDKKEVQFLFAGIENIKDDVIKPKQPIGDNETVKSINPIPNNEIKLPANAIRTTKTELDKLKAARAKDPMGFANAQMAGNGVSVSMTPSKSPGATPIKNTFNNPIELPEKN